MFTHVDGSLEGKTSLGTTGLHKTGEILTHRTRLWFPIVLLSGFGERLLAVASFLVLRDDRATPVEVNPLCGLTSPSETALCP